MHAATHGACEDCLDPNVYRENVDFWDRAWKPVKTPYTQMPDLPYILAVPEKLEAGSCQRVLDLGCGSGWLSIMLARAGFQVTGVDIAEQAINLARAWADQENLSQTDFQVSDISSMDCKGGTFDAVVANSIFEHLTPGLAASTLQTLRHILREGGLFFGCFDKVGSGPGEYYKLEDGTHVYTDKGRRGMLLRYFNDDELRGLFDGWTIESFDTIDSGSRIVWAHT
jgi:SAM-dependent methyltransferase